MHLLPEGVDLSNPVAGFASAARALAGPQQRQWVILVDDLHLLDTTSAVLLRQLMDAGVIRLIATVRTGEPMGEAVATLGVSDSVLRIDLEPLDRAQVEELLEQVLGGAVGRRTANELFAASRGNPLYLRELVIGALDAGTLNRDGEVWESEPGALLGTPLLTDLIKKRLTSTSIASRALLNLLALCEPVSLTDAQSVASMPTLLSLEEADLIHVTVDQRRTALSLAHPLYGEALRAELSPSHRHEVLLQQAERTEAHGARRRDDPLHIASWRLEATATAAPALLLQAAELARHSHDYVQVITLLDALPEKYHTMKTRLLYGEALIELAQWRKAEEVLVAADSQAVMEAERLAIAIARTMNMLWANADSSAALAINEAAMSQVRAPASQHILRVNDAVLRTVSGEPKRGLAVLEELLEQDAHQAPDLNVWLTGAVMKAVGLTAVGRTRDGQDWAQRAHAAHKELNEGVLVPHPASQLISLCYSLAEAGRLSEARSIGERAFIDLLAARAPLPQIWMAYFLGHAEWISGHVLSAKRWYAESISLSRKYEQDRAMRLSLSGLAASAAVLNELNAALSADLEAKNTQEIGFLAGEDRLGEAWLYVAHGKISQACEVLTEGAATARESGHLTAEALLLTDIARLGGAGEVAGRLAELAEVCDGKLAPARARLAAALAADDPSLLQSCAAELAGIGADLLAAEAATTASAALRRAGAKRQATAAAQLAATYVARCQGAHTPLLAPAEATSPLTRREREIAGLAAEGTPSKEIAQILTLSTRTVDNHLQRIYSKLGVTTRQQLARALSALI
jgi:DNA-binding CsgD family transcriptional regulator